MIPTSQLVPFTRAYLRGRGIAWCVTCRKPIPAENTDVQLTPIGMRLVFICHGAMEWCDVTETESPERLADEIKRAARVFLRSVATHGTVSPEARRERRQLRKV